MREEAFQNRHASCGDDRGDAGFTFVELLVVLAMITMIAGPRVLGYIGTAKADTARTQIHNLSNAVELYCLDTGSYPSADKGLAALTAPDGVPGWNGPYLKSASGLQDPWAHPYCDELAADGFRVFSLGRDGAAGGSGEDEDLPNRRREAVSSGSGAGATFGRLAVGDGPSASSVPECFRNRAPGGGNGQRHDSADLSRTCRIVTITSVAQSRRPR